MSRFAAIVAAAVCIIAANVITFAHADDYHHVYEQHEEVTLWVNKVGPYHNPQETYAYYSVPFCKPSGKTIKHKSDGVGALLEGSDLTDSGFKLHFRENQKNSVLCDKKLSADDVAEFTHAVRSHYWYQMYLDELPLWGMVGEYMTAADNGKGDAAAKEQGFIYTHREFSISYNGDQIIEVNLTSEKPVALVADVTVPFTYSVTWVKTDKSFAKRFDRYLDFNFFEHQIHWFSIFNSFMMVVFLCGLVALILMRTLKKDYARYSIDDADDMELDRVVDESGWKQVHGDVFRAPPALPLYAALLGTGYQLIALVFCVIGLAIAGSMYHARGTIVSTFLAAYAVTSAFAGYGSAYFYKRYGGTQWKHVMVLTTVLFPGVAFCIVFALNVIAIAYASSAAISLYSLIVVSAIWLFVSCPLVMLGTIAGRSAASGGGDEAGGKASAAAQQPCRVNTLVRPIPDGPFYTSPVAMTVFGGILPFGSIFIEMYFVFTSFWNYKFYYVYGFMLLVYCILICVTLCVTIVSTYFLLNAEDHRWLWSSFATGASAAGYVYVYSIYYFFTKTRMYGLMQTCFYFGYMSIFCLALAVVGGTIGYTGTNWFVRRIYSLIKSD